MKSSISALVAAFAGCVVPNAERATAQDAAAAQTYIRSIAPGRAILRAGREESVIAVLRGGTPSPRPLTAVLFPPEGVRVVGDSTRALGPLEADGLARLEWRIQAPRPVRGTILVALRDEASRLFAPAQLPIQFEPRLPDARADDIPEPVHAPSTPLILSHHCPLWKYGAHLHGWDTIAPWPERKPAIGYYDEGTPAATDWHIKYALEHGIDGFIYVWDKTLMNPLDRNSLASAIDDGFLQARFRDRFQFCLNWNMNYPGHNGVRDAAEVLDEILPFWLERYFGHASYVKLDGKPLLFVNQPDALCEQLGGAEATRRVFDEMRARVVAAGFPGLLMVGCVPCAKPEVQARMAVAGYDASSAYDLWVDGWSGATTDRHGVPAFSHREMMARQREVLEAKKEAGQIPDIVSVHMGWDSRAWHGDRATYYMAEPSAAAFELACRNAADLLDKTPGNGIDTRILVLNNWNEFGEGHYIAPTTGFGFAFLDAVRRVFTSETTPCRHIIPEDIGLEPPDTVYRASRETLRKPFGDDRRPKGDVAAWWSFDRDTTHRVFDTAGGGFDGFRRVHGSEAGISGHALTCPEGAPVTMATHAAFFPTAGVTVELWCKPNRTESTSFLINTSSEPNTGYGIALERGVPTLYLNWSYRVQAARPVAPYEWTHLVAVSDNRELVLYVNGAEVARGPGQQVVAPQRGKICLGSYSGTANPVFEGALDEVRVHRRPLTSAEVRSAYQAFR